MRSEIYTIIEITMFKGRSLEAKRILYSEIVKNLEDSPGINGMDILIVIHESKLENWGIRGGKLPNEAELEFKIDV
ncbi:MAG: tautomerase family protein [Promethearchaeota archaeon]